MIPAIIMLLMRRYQKTHPQYFLLLRAKMMYTARVLLFLLIALALVIFSKAQEKKLSYTIKRNGSQVGSMNISEVIQGSRISLRLQSVIKTRFIFSFSAKATEEAVYDKGLLLYSSIYQKLNGNEKMNKETRYVNNGYVIKEGDNEESLNNIQIRYNLVCLYGHEPLNTAWIYSDKYQKFLPIQKIEEHHYRISFPDGSANEYWYKNGLCTKVRINHSLYSAVMELNQ